MRIYLRLIAATITCVVFIASNRKNAAVEHGQLHCDFLVALLVGFHNLIPKMGRPAKNSSKDGTWEESLINAVFLRPCLYDIRHKDYTQNRRKESIWKEIAEELGTDGKNFNSNELLISKYL